MKVAVILSGCGHLDGSEIHEATLSLWALSKYDISYECFAPNKEQFHVMNHLTRQEVEEKRNVLVEAARIARGNIKPLSELNVCEFSALVMPGGYGAAKNLFTYAYDGKNFSVDKDIENKIIKFHEESKPIVALCISPLMLAKVLKAKVTMGNDKETSDIVNFVGGTSENKNFDEICFDNNNKIITTACYMLQANPYQISLGIEKAIIKLKELI